MNYSTFKKYVSQLDSVQSVSGKNSYVDIKVQDNLVSFRRADKEEEEIIILSELYQFFSKGKAFTTSEAREYISGRVQSPATAIIRAIHDLRFENEESLFGGIRNYIEDSGWGKFLGNMGCLTMIVLFVGSFLYSMCFEEHESVLPEENEVLIVRFDNYGVYEESTIPRLEELMNHKDVFGLMLLQDQGLACYLESGEKCKYVGYIKGGYYLVRTKKSLRPVIVYKNFLTRNNNNNKKK